jgi:hypothetical protein
VRRPARIAPESAEFLLLDNAECLVSGATARIVREWAGMLRGYVSIRRGGCFRISSESVWQSGLRRLNKHHQSQKDKLRERLFMVSRSSQRDAEDARSDALSTTHSSDGQDSLTKHSKFFVRTEAVVIKPLPDDCVLEIGIEYCVARRPSRNGSLMGSSQAYVDHCTKLKALVEEMLGGDTSKVHFVVNEPGLIAFDLQPQQHAFGTGSLSAAGTGDAVAPDEGYLLTPIVSLRSAG